MRTAAAAAAALTTAGLALAAPAMADEAEATQRIAFTCEVSGDGFATYLVAPTGAGKYEGPEARLVPDPDGPLACSPDGWAHTTVMFVYLKH